MPNTLLPNITLHTGDHSADVSERLRIYFSQSVVSHQSALSSVVAIDPKVRCVFLRILTVIPLELSYSKSLPPFHKSTSGVFHSKRRTPVSPKRQHDQRWQENAFLTFQYSIDELSSTNMVANNTLRCSWCALRVQPRIVLPYCLCPHLSICCVHRCSARLDFELEPNPFDLKTRHCTLHTISATTK